MISAAWGDRWSATGNYEYLQTIGGECAQSGRLMGAEMAV
jgi:hypothetical protein